MPIKIRKARPIPPDLQKKLDKIEAREKREKNAASEVKGAEAKGTETATKSKTQRQSKTAKPEQSDIPATKKSEPIASNKAKTTPSKKRKAEADSEDIKEEASTTTPAKSKRQRKSKAAEETAADIEVKEESDTEVKTKSTPKATSKTKGKVKEESDSEVKAKSTPKAKRKTKEGESGPPEPKVKRKTKEEKEAEKMPLAARAAGHKLFIGAHVSASGGVHKAVLNSVHIGANAFALFLKSQRKWANPALTDEVASMFHENCRSHSYDAGKHVVPHGSYLVNLAHTDAARTTQAYDSFLDDLQRCERLGIKLYNFHPGNTTGGDRAVAIKHLASNINRAHKATNTVVTLLENMAAGGNIIGTTFEDLRDTISHIDDKDRVGVCLDTCHAFAAGYDLRTPDAFKATLEQFDEIVGLKYLRALHLNDSKAPFESHRDLHAQIGTGYLGLRAFHNIVNEPHFIGLPMVLETPTTTTDEDGEPLKDEKGNTKEDASSWAREIKLLESLVGMDTDSEEFTSLETALARKGAKERQRLGDQAERRKVKDAKKAAKGKKRKAEESEDDEDDD